MTKFKGTNDDSSFHTFYYRSLYRRDAFENIIGKKPEIKDLSIAENVLYGRVDVVLNTVYPKTAYLRTISSKSNVESSYRLIDFVADAFENVSEAMNSAVENGTIANNQPIFSKFFIKKAYESPITLYNNHVDDYLNRYVNEYLRDKNNKRFVLNYGQFINHFFEFMKNDNMREPFTFTTFQRSTRTNIFTSGIAVDIGGLPFGDDSRIENLVIKNSCFRYYLKVCRANGFCVSKLAPTTMVADIMSPGLLPYARSRGIVRTGQVFLERYNFAYREDYNFMQTKLLDGYNSFVTQFPFEKINTSKCSKIFTSSIEYRKQLTTSEAEKLFSKFAWLELYSKIRNVEEDSVLNKNSMQAISKGIKIRNSLDINKTMRYINEEFRLTYKSKYGGTNYLIKRQNLINEEQDTIETTQETTQVISESDDTITDTIAETINTGITTTTQTGGGSSGGY